MFKKLFKKNSTISKANIAEGTSVACDFGHSKTLLLELRKTSAKLYLEKFEFLRGSAKENNFSDILKTLLNEKKFAKKGLRIAMKGQGVIMRFIQFPKMKPEDLKSALQYEAEQYIPFSMNEVILEYCVLENRIKTDRGEFMEILLVAVKRQELEPVLDIFLKAECELEIVDIDILAAMTALEYFHPEDFGGHVAILDIGTEISTIGVIDKSKPRFIRDISYGVYDMRKRLKARLAVSEDDVESMLEKNEAMSSENEKVLCESLENLVSDVKISLDYYKEQIRHDQNEVISKLFVTGGTSHHPSVMKALAEGLQLSALNMNIMEKLKTGEHIDKEGLTKSLPFLPVALGLAIRDS